MSLTLHVDGDCWRTHLRALADSEPALVPVVKGNGYGFGLARLARKAEWLGVDTLAVGTYDEVSAVEPRFDQDLLVLTPWRPFGAAKDQQSNPRLIHTVSRVVDIADLLNTQPGARFVLERATSMLRHGMDARALRAAGRVLKEAGRHRLEGIALHLPLEQGSHLSEVQRLMHDVVAAELDTRTIWVSHLTRGELASLRAAFPEYVFRPRIGTDLWLGERAALRVTATVLDVHPVQRGDVFGYRGRTAPRAGHVLVVSGGTAHGIGLESPTGDTSLKSRAASIARGGLDAMGFVRSPYSIDGKQRLFAEPPHMQASMLFLPAGARVPHVGDEIDVRVRFTATQFDRVVVS
ncbi:MAG: alanine racemase [Nocardioides sp.]|jgi:alanine racemase